MAKRGQSEVITTVLIILLVLVAVFIVYVVVRNMVKQGSDDIVGDVFTTTLSIDKKNTILGTNSLVVVERGAGAGEIAGVKLVVKNSSGASGVYTEYGNIGELETKSISIPPAVNVTNISYVEVYAVVKTGSGKDKIGPKQDSAGVSETSGTTSPPPTGCTTPAQCDDANVCNGQETCVNPGANGQCQAGTSLTCSDGNSCTTDSCNPSSGCIYTAITSCANNDGCCPGGCTSVIDNDCAAAPSVPTDYTNFWKFETFSGTSGDVMFYDKTGRKNGTVRSYGIATFLNYQGCVSGTNCIRYIKDNSYSYSYLNSDVGVSNNFAISIWFYPTDAISSTRRDFLYLTNHAIYFSTNQNNFSLSGGYPSATLTGPMSLNKWNHIVFNWNGVVGSVYVNGTIAGGPLPFYGMGDLSDYFYFGGAVTGYSYSGSVDEVMLFNRTLSAAEVQALYTANYNAAPLA